MFHSMECSVQSEGCHGDHHRADPIRAQFDDHQRVLNISDAKLACWRYTVDRAYVPALLPTACGDELLGAYGQAFQAIRLDVTFTIDEIVIAGADIARVDPQQRHADRPVDRNQVGGGRPGGFRVAPGQGSMEAHRAHVQRGQNHPNHHDMDCSRQRGR